MNLREELDALAEKIKALSARLYKLETAAQKKSAKAAIATGEAAPKAE